MKKIFITLVLTISALYGGGFEDLGISARVKSLGGAGSALQNAPYLQFYNPASFARAQEFAVSASYSNLYPDVEDDNLNFVSLSGLIPVPYVGKFAAGFNMFNTELWKEYTFQAGYAIELMPGLNVGGAFKLLGWSAEAAPGEAALSYTGFTVDAGAIYTIDELFYGDFLSLGLSIKNITQPSIASSGSSDGTLPMILTLGTAYYSKKYEYFLLADVEMEKDNITARVGVEFLTARYQIFGVNNDFFLRGGYNNLVSADFARDSGISGGFGLNVEMVKLDYAYLYPLEIRFIGGSHKLTLTYNL